MNENKEDIGVVVLTKTNGVYFGYISELSIPDNRTIGLSGVRIAVYWPEATRGIVGLAATGPGSGSKITAAAPYAIIADVQTILQCTDGAINQWEKGIWN